MTDIPRVTSGRVRHLLVMVLILAALLVVHIHFSQWHPQIWNGRQPFHFWLLRMVPAVLLVLCLLSFSRLFASGLLAVALLTAVGTISSLKEDFTGVPLRFSDLSLSGKGALLSMYLTPGVVAAVVFVLLSAIVYFKSARVRWWSLPLAAVCLLLLSSYRFEPVRDWVKANHPMTGIRDMYWDQSANLKLNGLGTYLYFSSFWPSPARFSETQVKEAMKSLPAAEAPSGARGNVLPDIYLVQGEAWWRDPADAQSGLDLLLKSGFQETTAISPVYGGGTPNSEFEVMTGIPADAFAEAGATYPYVDFASAFSDQSRTLVRFMKEHGYQVNVFHNYNPNFWQRTVVYRKFGVDGFVSLDDMHYEDDGDWPPKDQILYDTVSKHDSEQLLNNPRPQLDFLITMETHGPFKDEQDYHERLARASKRLVAFKQTLDERGRDYVLIAYGDHLPGLSDYQHRIGMKDGDPRYHAIPVFVAGNVSGLDELSRSIAGKPLYCLGGELLDTLGLLKEDSFINHVNQKCSAGGQVAADVEAPLYYNRLFAPHPMR